MIWWLCSSNWANRPRYECWHCYQFCYARRWISIKKIEKLIRDKISHCTNARSEAWWVNTIRGKSGNLERSIVRKKWNPIRAPFTTEKEIVTFVFQFANHRIFSSMAVPDLTEQIPSDLIELSSDGTTARWFLVFCNTWQWFIILSICEWFPS